MHVEVGHRGGEQLALSTEHGMMDERHRDMWQVVAKPEEVPAALASAPPWSKDALGFATV